MVRLSVFLLACYCVPVPVAAQLEAQFYLDKENFIVKEPIYVHYKVTNTGKTPLEIETGPPACTGPDFKVTLTHAFPSHPSDGCYGRRVGCGAGIGNRTLEPGKSWAEDILLNDDHDLGSPGTYYIAAFHELPFGDTKADVRLSKQKLGTTANFQIAIEKGSEADLKAILQPYITDLDSKDRSRRAQAQFVIMNTGPEFLEGRIVEMLKSDSDTGFALESLRKINTPDSRKALAEFAATGVQWSETALQYLGEMGDPTYYPLLLKTASESAPGSNLRQTAIRGAARLDGNSFFPFLRSLLKNDEKWDRINAVQGMYESSSREAVPILIDLLRDKDDFIARMAAGALAALTHRTPTPGDTQAKAPIAQYDLWRNWWSLHGKTAPIYRSTACGEIESLQ